MDIVELEALDEGPVEQRGGGRARAQAVADQRRTPRRLPSRTPVRRPCSTTEVARPTSAQPMLVERQVLRTLQYVRGNVAGGTDASHAASRRVGPFGSVGGQACVEGSFDWVGSAISSFSLRRGY